MNLIKYSAALLSSAVLLTANGAIAQSAQWTRIAENSVKDRFFVDASSIQRNGSIVWYWEYREFPEANNALLDVKVDQPVHGAVIRWSADCSNGAQRLRKVNAYTTNRKLIQKFDYGNDGMLLRPQAGSSTHKVMDYVCRSSQKR
ncbi:surface-adhesin E family protein [Leptolyngbya sp. AN03gr2]|uniref:surface-adhesin E family protein n=1 Tax=unclassified Leptolyngbya TaxID=2650499 RepID=UPI003D32101F